MDCQHQFFQTYSNITKPDPKSPFHQPDKNSTARVAAHVYRELFGVKVTCANCGEVREVWEDGEVKTTIAGHDTSNT